MKDCLQSLLSWEMAAYFHNLRTGPTNLEHFKRMLIGMWLLNCVFWFNWVKFDTIQIKCEQVYDMFKAVLLKKSILGVTQRYMIYNERIGMGRTKEEMTAVTEMCCHLGLGCVVFAEQEQSAILGTRNDCPAISYK